MTTHTHTPHQTPTASNQTSRSLATRVDEWIIPDGKVPGGNLKSSPDKNEKTYKTIGRLWFGDNQSTHKAYVSSIVHHPQGAIVQYPETGSMTNEAIAHIFRADPSKALLSNDPKDNKEIFNIHLTTNQSLPHIPQVAVAQSSTGSVFSGASSGAPSRPLSIYSIHSARDKRASTVISGTGDDIAMRIADNIGGEWEREGFGKGMEERLEEVSIAGRLEEPSIVSKA
ncbi:hypothetical protein M422DRAFT_247536 [Sphaerobolus stellatus SS14]|nr:hypothetical protein M422DRAFT_247536 [Sphaerobolus stellatus SS14]